MRSDGEPNAVLAVGELTRESGTRILLQDVVDVRRQCQVTNSRLPAAWSYRGQETQSKVRTVDEERRNTQSQGYVVSESETQ